MRVSRAVVGCTTLIQFLVARPVGSQALVPVGVQGQVNTYAINAQQSPAVGFDGDGNFVVVWTSKGSGGTDTSEESIQGRAFNSKGISAGFDTQVNTYTTDRQLSPDVAVNDNGDFVVVWTSRDMSPYVGNVKAQRFGPDGQPVGGEFRVNSYTSGLQTRPAVAMNAEGAFVVIWQSYGSPGDDDDYESIQGQRFDSDGSPVGGQFQVNNYTTSPQLRPAVAMHAAGAFVVVWHSYGSFGNDNSSSSINGRIYNSNGVAVGPEAQVNTYTTLDQRSPKVAVRGDGVFTVVWESYSSVESGDSSYSYSIQGRIYNSNGLPFGPEAQINTYTTGDQRTPDVAADREGNFLVVWRSEGSSGNDNSGKSIQGRAYASNGLPVGPDFQINTYTTNDQISPSVEIDARGYGTVVWASDGSSGSDVMEYSIQGQRFAVPFIFGNGFESGDTSAWSPTAP